MLSLKIVLRLHVDRPPPLRDFQLITLFKFVHIYSKLDSGANLKFLINNHEKDVKPIRDFWNTLYILKLLS